MLVIFSCFYQEEIISSSLIHKWNMVNELELTWVLNECNFTLVLLSNLSIKTHRRDICQYFVVMPLCPQALMGSKCEHFNTMFFFPAPRYNSKGSCGASRKRKGGSICKCATTAQFNCGGSLWSYSWSKNSFFFHASLRLFLPPRDSVHYSLVYFVVCLLATFFVCL